MQKKKRRVLFLIPVVLILCLIVFLVVAKSTKASTMQLMKTEGTVNVTDGNGSSQTTRDKMRLYNGYHLETEEASYAWVNLDSAKLVKLDEVSEAEVRKSDKDLELLLNSGNLFFNVTSPLQEDETLNIRTSTMAVGIRGTCGWVKMIDQRTAEIYVLEGAVQCSVTDTVTGQTKTETVRGGEKATAVIYPQDQAGDKCEIILEQFEVGDIDDFVLIELLQDPDLCDKIYEDSGLDVRSDDYEQEEPVGDGDWTFFKKEGLLVISVTGQMEDYSSYTDTPWYQYMNDITAVEIKDSVTSIGDRAFYRSVNLTSVTIPDSVTSIGNWAFYFCSALPEVTIPDSVTSIRDHAFSNCTSLTSANIPDSVTDIGWGAFYKCPLTSIEIPDSVTSIGEGAFSGCALTSIDVASGNPAYISVDGVLFDAAQTLLISYPMGRNDASYQIPATVTRIGEDAFWNCDQLTSVTIPDGVTSIGYDAFMHCYGLTSVTIPDSVTEIGSGAFANCTALTSINVSSGNPAYIFVDGVLFSKDQTLLHTYLVNQSSASYRIPATVTNIQLYAFYKCNLTSVTIPDSVTVIQNNAFWNCEYLTDVYYDGSEDDWGKITIDTPNKQLTDGTVTIHYNS